LVDGLQGRPGRHAQIYVMNADGSGQTNLTNHLVVEFYRKKNRIAKRKSNGKCMAKLKVEVSKTTRFRAVSPEQDFDHLAGTSKPVKVRS
jgi:Tol biopolymer transport system component